MALPGKDSILLAVAALSITQVLADAPVRHIQDGPAGYTIACALVDQPGMRSCTDLPSAQACSHQLDFASRPSQEPTGMTFVNRSDQAVEIFWLDFRAYRRLYHNLPPGGRITQDTLIGHNWLITTTAGRCVGIFKAAPEALAFF